MELLENEDGQKKSITIDGIQEFQWAPHANFFAYTAFPSNNVHPRIGFIEIPSRRELSLITINQAVEFKMYFHPQGNFLAVMNKFKEKKHHKYSVELFDTKNNLLPH